MSETQKIRYLDEVDKEKKWFFITLEDALSNISQIRDSKKDFVKCFSGRPDVFFYDFEPRYGNPTFIPTWPYEGGKYKTYSNGNRIRDIRILDPAKLKNVIDPYLASRHYMTHFPKDKNCPVCCRCKIRKRKKESKGKFFILERA